MSCSREKKIHFQDSLSLGGWRVTRVDVRDRDGSRGMGRDEEKNSSRLEEELITRDFFQNYAKFSFICNSHWINHHFRREIIVPRINKLRNCNWTTWQRRRVGQMRENEQRSKKNALCFVLFHFFFSTPCSSSFQENGRKFYNKIEATGSS